MDLSALLLSRIQFAFTVSFHIIFPAFTIGLAAWLTVLEALHLATSRPVYRRVFEFWLGAADLQRRISCRCGADPETGIQLWRWSSPAS
jgi:cytochrome bd-type quinol oxidase subunit 1